MRVHCNLLVSKLDLDYYLERDQKCLRHRSNTTPRLILLKGNTTIKKGFFKNK